MWKEKQVTKTRHFSSAQALIHLISLLWAFLFIVSDLQTLLGISLQISYFLRTVLLSQKISLFSRYLIHINILFSEKLHWLSPHQYFIRIKILIFKMHLILTDEIEILTLDTGISSLNCLCFCAFVLFTPHQGYKRPLYFHRHFKYWLFRFFILKITLFNVSISFIIQAKSLFTQLTREITVHLKKK